MKKLWVLLCALVALSAAGCSGYDGSENVSTETQALDTVLGTTTGSCTRPTGDQVFWIHVDLSGSRRSDLFDEFVFLGMQNDSCHG